MTFNTIVAVAVVVAAALAYKTRASGSSATARQNRLGEARPTVPNALDWLMLATVVVLLAVLGAATQAAVDTRIHVTLVVAAAILFAATLLLISDLDQPYAGAIRRDPTQTEFILNQIAPQVRGPLPCDRTGVPTGVSGFQATTAPLS